MQTVEEAARPPLLPIFLSVIALFVLVALCTLTPYQQPVARTTLRVPAVLLPLKTFTAQVVIIPAGFTVGKVTTDAPVYVPPGNANGYGVAYVVAHAVISGTAGNIPPYAIDTVEGSSVYIRNLSAFSGGRDSYSVKIITPKDRQTALEKARQLLTQESTGLRYPCKEVVSSSAYQHVMWVCQFVTYKIPPFMSVTGVSLQGKNLLIHVWFVAHPTHIWAK